MKDITKLRIEYKSINSLIPYAKNARLHSKEQIAQVAQSIKEFGFTNPVLIDNKNNIVAGHCRILSAQKLKMKEVPTIQLGFVSEAAKKAYMIADNKLALNADWSIELLIQELDELQESGFDVDLTGFGEEELDELLKGNEEIEDIENVDNFNDKFNFIISCADLTELATVQHKLNTDSKKINAINFLKIIK